MGDMTIGDLVSDDELERLRLRARASGETLESYLRDVLLREAGPDEEERQRRKAEALARLERIRSGGEPMSREEADRFFEELREEREARTDRMIGLAK